MTYLEAIILGVIQGFGEFLPISSSAHLVVARWCLEFSKVGVAFDVALHLGTLFAVLIYFWKDWLNLIVKPIQFFILKDKTKENEDAAHLLFKLILGTIPAGILALVFKDFSETHLRGPVVVALSMILLGVVLYFIDKKSNHNQMSLTKLSYKAAILIGASQALAALFPGVSRSGITITTALLFGLNRKESARFSFLLSTPIVLAACLLHYQFLIQAFTNPIPFTGILVSAIVGFLCIRFLIHFVSQYSYKVFCYYRVLFGILVLLLFFFREFA